MTIEEDESKSSKSDECSNSMSTLPNDDARKMKGRAPEVMIRAALLLLT